MVKNASPRKNENVKIIFLAGGVNFTYNWPSRMIDAIRSRCPGYDCIINPDINEDDIRRINQTGRKTVIIINPRECSIAKRPGQIDYERNWLKLSDFISFYFVSRQLEEDPGETELIVPYSTNPIVIVEYNLYKDCSGKELAVGVDPLYPLIFEVQQDAKNAGVPLHGSLEALSNSVITWIHSDKKVTPRIQRHIPTIMLLEEPEVYLAGPFDLDKGQWQAKAQRVLQDVAVVHNPHEFQDIVPKHIARKPEERKKQWNRENERFARSTCLFFVFLSSPDGTISRESLGPNAIWEFSGKLKENRGMQKTMVVMIDPRYEKATDLLYLLEEQQFPKQFIHSSIEPAMLQVKEICVATKN